MQAPAESKAKAEVRIVHVLLRCEEEVEVLVGGQYDHELACPLARACSDAHGGFFHHPKPDEPQGACFRIFPLNQILRGRGTFEFAIFLFLAEFVLRRAACCADYTADIDRVCAENRRYSWNAQLSAARYFG